MLPVKRGMIMQKGRGRCPPKQRRRKTQGAQTVGLLLIALGLTLLFLCIPGWAWAALAGCLLVAAGYLLIRLGGR